MASDFEWNDRYAGDAAWREWFEICSVSGCSSVAAGALRAQIASALYAQLARCGFARTVVGEDDPIAFFDSYFQLKGSREKPKPLKRYFAHRIEIEGLQMRDFVCGTLFSAGAGRVRDIVTDWIAVHKGWKGRTITSADGKRHFEWEGAGPEEPAEETDLASDPTRFLDEHPIREEVAAALERTARKTKVEKTSVALLSVVTALDISLTEPVVLDALGVGKSRAYLLRDKVMTQLAQEISRTEGADDPLLGRLLLEASEAALAPGVLQRLEEGA